MIRHKLLLTDYRFVKQQNEETTHIKKNIDSQLTLCGASPISKKSPFWVECGSVTLVSTQCVKCFNELRQIVAAKLEEN